VAPIFSHAAAGAALSIAFAPVRAATRFWVVALVLAVLPDADSLLYYFRISFYSIGHRGFFHSPFFGLIVCFVVMALFFREEVFFSGRWFGYFSVFFSSG
jgi:inner membrane protein